MIGAVQGSNPKNFHYPVHQIFSHRTSNTGCYKIQSLEDFILISYTDNRSNLKQITLAIDLVEGSRQNEQVRYILSKIKTKINTNIQKIDMFLLTYLYFREEHILD